MWASSYLLEHKWCLKTQGTAVQLRMLHLIGESDIVWLGLTKLLSFCDANYWMAGRHFPFQKSVNPITLSGVYMTVGVFFHDSWEPHSLKFFELASCVHKKKKKSVWLLKKYITWSIKKIKKLVFFRSFAFFCCKQLCMLQFPYLKISVLCHWKHSA